MLSLTSDHKFNFESILANCIIGYTDVQSTISGCDVSYEEWTVHLHHSPCLVDAICRRDWLPRGVLTLISTCITDAKDRHVKSAQSFGGRCGDAPWRSWASSIVWWRRLNGRSIPAESRPWMCLRWTGQFDCLTRLDDQVTQTGDDLGWHSWLRLCFREKRKD